MKFLIFLMSIILLTGSIGSEAEKGKYCNYLLSISKIAFNIISIQNENQITNENFNYQLVTVPLIVTIKHFAFLMEAMTELVSLAHPLATKSAKIPVMLIKLTRRNVNRNVKVNSIISFCIFNIYFQSLRNYNFNPSTSMYVYLKDLMASQEEINHQPQAFEEELHLLNMQPFLQFSLFSKRHFYEGLKIVCQLAVVNNKTQFK